MTYYSPATKLWLKPNVLAEPLIFNWYAWSFLVSPATAAMLIHNKYLALIQSYLNDPQLHAQALQNESMQGGPFIRTNALIEENIAKLYEEMLSKCGPQMELAKAITQMEQLLQTYGTGGSLEDCYEKVPIPLRGYVELFYDLRQQANFRLIEALLYCSPYNLEKHQTVMFSEVTKDYREFIINTPRFANDEQVILSLPFHSPFYDTIFQSRSKPMRYDRLCGLFHQYNIIQEDKSRLLRYFTDQPSSSEYPLSILKGNQIRVRYFGHACVLIQSAHCSIMIDPIISYQYSGADDRYTYADLPDSIDYLLITHAHQDHVIIEHLLQLRHKVKQVIVPKSDCGQLQDPSLKLFFQHIGFQDVMEIDDMEKILIPNGSITGIPFLGEHGDLNIQTKKAHLIELFGKKIMCAADSNNIEPVLYEHVRKIIGNVDILFIGMECEGAPLSWVYGPLLAKKVTRKNDQMRRLNGSNYASAIRLVKSLRCQRAYVYALAKEPWFSYVLNINHRQDSPIIIDSNRFVDNCRSEGIESEVLFIKKEILL